MATQVADLYCPHCQGPLRPDPAPEGLRWRCARGHGLAATTPVVSRRGDADPVSKAWVAAKPATKDGRACPSCRTPMSLTSFSSETVDVCRRCHLLWFDEGEYARTEPAPPTPKQTRPLEVRLALARAELAVLDARKQAEDEAPGIPDEDWKVAAGVAGLPFDRGEGEGPTPGTWLVLLLLIPVLVLSAAERSGRSVSTFVATFAGTEYLTFLFGRIVEWRLGHLRLLLLAAGAAGAQLTTGWIVHRDFWEDPYAAEAVVTALGTCALLLDPKRRYGFLDGGLRRDLNTGSPYTWWNVPGWLLLALWLLLQLFTLGGFGPVALATLIGIAAGVLAALTAERRRSGRTAAVLIASLAATGATMATDLEVVVHDATPTGAGVGQLDLLLCRSGPCTAVAITDGKGRAVFEDVDAGEVSITAMTIGCGPFQWPVMVKPSPAAQKVDVVVPANGWLSVRIMQPGKDGSTVPLAGKRVEFLIKTQTDLPGFPQLSGTTTETDDRGFTRLCLPAEVELDVSVHIEGFQAGTLPRRQLKPGEAASAQITLRTDLPKQP